MMTSAYNVTRHAKPSAIAAMLSDSALLNGMDRGLFAFRFSRSLRSVTQATFVAQDARHPDWAQCGHLDVPYMAPCVFSIPCILIPFDVAEYTTLSLAQDRWNLGTSSKREERRCHCISHAGNRQVAPLLSAIRSDESIHARPHGFLNASIA